MNNTLAPAAVKITIKTEVIDEYLFTKHIESPLREKTVNRLTTKCLNDQDIYEQQCCPGKQWPFYVPTTALSTTTMTAATTEETNETTTTSLMTTTTTTPMVINADCVNPSWGVQFLNPYFDGKELILYVIAQGDREATCCANAKSISKRKKRAVDETYFDQIALAEFIENGGL